MKRFPAQKSFAVIKRHDEFLAYYRGQEWEAAAEMIAELMELAAPYNLEGYYQTLKKRIESFKSSPPPSDWQGVHIAENK
jgi:adenylate cyclase